MIENNKSKAHFLSKALRQLTVQWVLSHVRTPGSERANRLERVAHHLSPSTPCLPDPRRPYRYVRSLFAAVTNPMPRHGRHRLSLRVPPRKKLHCRFPYVLLERNQCLATRACGAIVDVIVTCYNKRLAICWTFERVMPNSLYYQSRHRWCACF